MTTRNASDQTTLNSAFAASVTGDVINITGWSGSMLWNNRNYSGPITIECNGFGPTGLLIQNCSKIICRNMTINGPTSNTNGINDVMFDYGTNNPDITFVNLIAQASNYASINAYSGFFNTAGESHCIFVPSGATAARLSLINPTLRGRKYAGTFYATDGMLIENGNIDYCSSDSFKIVGVAGGGIIRNNLFPRRHFPYPGSPPGDSATQDHADAMIQFTSDCNGFEMYGNVFLPQVDDHFGFSGVLFGSNGNMTRMKAYQNLFAAPGDAGIIFEDPASSISSEIYNNTGLCYFADGFIVSRTQMVTNNPDTTKKRLNFEGTYRSDLATAQMLTNNPAGPAGTRINSVYQTRYGASTDFHLYKMEPIDFNPVPGSAADPNTFGVNTRGAYQTIAQILAGTWSGPAWDGPTLIGAGPTPNMVIGSSVFRGGY